MTDRSQGIGEWVGHCLGTVVRSCLFDKNVTRRLLKRLVAVFVLTLVVMNFGRELMGAIMMPLIGVFLIYAYGQTRSEDRAADNAAVHTVQPTADDSPYQPPAVDNDPFSPTNIHNPLFHESDFNDWDKK